ncbi:MAG: hypothetical protein U9O20_04870 [Patescibacteria group bacterium]|nr:hypothetical protein [Patescibacteria group bacterium]
MADSLQKSILFTVVYFSSYKYPLTSFELWRHLIKKGQQRGGVSYGQIIKVLEQEPLASKLQVKDGFITLKNEVHLVDRHLAKSKLSLANIIAMKKWARIFLWLPYVRGVFVTGTLSMKNASSESDWDILLVLAKNRIWVGRLLVSGALHVFGKRRHGEKVKRRFCLNHYLTDNGLILDEHNEFCANFVTFSAPIFGEIHHRKYLALNEHWIKSFNPNYTKDEVPNETLLIKSSMIGYLRGVLEWFFEFFRIGVFVNNVSKKYMIKKIEKNPATHQQNADIRYSDVALIFLPKPHRIEMFEKTIEKLTKGV